MSQASSNSLRVGLAQTDATLGDLRSNLQRVGEVLERHRASADLLVFPELTLTGYAVGSRYHALSMRRDDPRLLALAQQSGPCTSVVGFIEETSGFQFFNAAAFLRDGQVVHVHRKLQLPNYGVFEEKKLFSEGADVALARVGAFDVAPFVCADAWNPGLAHVAASFGAHLFTYSVCSPAGGLGSNYSSQEGWKRLCRFYASIYGVYVVFVNRVGEEPGIRFWGESELVDPFGRTVATCRPDGEEVVVASIDLSVVRESRTVLHTIRDDDPALLVRHLQRVVDGVAPPSKERA